MAEKDLLIEQLREPFRPSDEAGNRGGRKARAQRVNPYPCGVTCDDAASTLVSSYETGIYSCGTVAIWRDVYGRADIGPRKARAGM